MIGGFIITGTAPKKVAVRAVGPSLAQAGITNPLSDPILELRDSSGQVVARNDNWRESGETEDDCRNNGLALNDDRESAIIASLAPGAYTAVVTGQNNGTGTGLVEVYDLDQSVDSKLANMSTRGLILSAENVMIGGFILGGEGEGTRVLVRAIGPSLTQLGLSGALPDPTLELHDGNGGLIRNNDNWRDSQESEIQNSGVAPSQDREAAVVATLPAGAYTAIVAGHNNSTGVGLIEVFHLE
jgi:uncharacterized protein (DUF2141 family)